MRPVHMYILLLKSQPGEVEAEAQAQTVEAQRGLLARLIEALGLRAVFSQWKLFNREGATHDTERT